MNKTRKGFTLIELLIVVVIIGILAATAIPKWADTKQRAYVTAMKSDLRKVVSAAEAYFADNNTYVGYTGQLGSSGVTIVMSNTSATGWSAFAVHAHAGFAKCEIGVGTGKPAGLAEGEPGGKACK